MYQAHFGLKELPFTLTPNTHFFLNSSSHKEALDLLMLALHNDEGFIKIVGEVGTGKTMLCRMLLNKLDDSFVTAYIPSPNLGPDSLRLALAEELQVSLPKGVGRHQLLKRINHKLIEYAKAGKRVVLMIDEAQAMPEDTVEAVRLLTNLETETAKLMQVVLFGQPELDELLGQKHLRQLQQRITFQQYLRPLDEDGISHYIQHRLIAAGYNGQPLFNAAAVKQMHRSSAGIPRLVNVLSHKAMMVAYGQGMKTVTKAHVKKADDDTQGAQAYVRPWWRRWLGLAVALPLVGLGMLAWSHFGGVS